MLASDLDIYELEAAVDGSYLRFVCPDDSSYSVDQIHQAACNSLRANGIDTPKTERPGDSNDLAGICKEVRSWRVPGLGRVIHCEFWPPLESTKIQDPLSQCQADPGGSGPRVMSEE